MTGFVVYDQRQRFAVLHSVYLYRTEMHYFGQHLQVAPDNRRGNIHHLLRSLVYLHECLAVPPVRRLHVRNDGFAVKKLFLLRLVIAFQRRGFQNGIEHHVRSAVVPADKGEAAAALYQFSFLVTDTHRKHGRVSTVANLIKDTHRQVLDHLLCKPESGQCRIGQFN